MLLSFLSKLSQSEIGQFIGEFYQVRYYCGLLTVHWMVQVLITQQYIKTEASDQRLDGGKA